MFKPKSCYYVQEIKDHIFDLKRIELGLNNAEIKTNSLHEIVIENN